MKSPHQLVLGILLIILFSACEDTPKPEDTADVTTEDTAVARTPVEPTLVPVDLSEAAISFGLQNEEEDEFGMPTATLHLHNSVTQDTLFLAKDVGGVLIDKKYYASFGLPDEAVLAIESYLAGGGNYYYVLVNENVLTVYRGFIGEPNPEVEAPDPASQYELFKRFTFYESEVVEENLQPAQE